MDQINRLRHLEAVPGDRWIACAEGLSYSSVYSFKIQYASKLIEMGCIDTVGGEIPFDSFKRALT